MNKEELFMFKRFVEAERRRIDVDKWHEGEKQRKDPGEEYVKEWIEKNALWFREAWNVSDCKFCNNWEACGYLVKQDCKNYKL